MNFELMRNADVAIEVGQDGNKGPIVSATFGDKYQHVFPHTSRISKALHTCEPDTIRDRLDGGQFFFVDDQLIDFRDSAYNGFVHEDASLSALMDIIGVITRDTDKASYVGHNKLVSRAASTTMSRDIALARVWDSREIEIPHYQTGGQFSNQLSFTWSPFHQNINSMFELVRLICTNGMVGLRSFLNANIPMVNRWEEHLDIAAMQIQNKVATRIGTRMTSMSQERATVADLQLITNHANERLRDESLTDPDQLQRLRNIWAISNPAMHLYNHYRPSVFEDGRLAAQMPGHLTSFDAWNLATEISSHTRVGGNSTDTGIQKLANRLVFDPIDNHSRAARYEQPPIAAFSSPERAFFGDVELVTAA